LGLLSRGYALVHDLDGHPVTRAAGLQPGTRLGVRFADGETRVRVEDEAGATPPR
jgi:exodeoxyribonuclease VII large subunit